MDKCIDEREESEIEVSKHTLASWHRKLCHALLARKKRLQEGIERCVTKVEDYNKEHSDILGLLFKEMCTQTCHWHAAPLHGGHTLFAELSPLLSLQRESVSNRLLALESAWSQRHATVSPAARKNVSVVWNPCSLGSCVCQRPVRDVLQRFRAWARQLCKEDVSNGVVVLEWRSFFTFGSEDLALGLDSDAELAGEVHYTHVSHVNWTPFRYVFTELNLAGNVLPPSDTESLAFRTACEESGRPKFYTMYEWLRGMNPDMAWDVCPLFLSLASRPMPRLDGAVVARRGDLASHRLWQGDVREGRQKPRRKRKLHEILEVEDEMLHAGAWPSRLFKLPKKTKKKERKALHPAKDLLLSCLVSLSLSGLSCNSCSWGSFFAKASDDLFVCEHVGRALVVAPCLGFFLTFHSLASRRPPQERHNIELAQANPSSL